MAIRPGNLAHRSARRPRVHRRPGGKGQVGLVGAGAPHTAALQVAVIEAYHRQCALSLGRVLPALEAAHIRPFGLGGGYEKSNGILLRRDIHSVFDAGYATFDEQCRFVVSARVRDIFHNGEEYRRLHGQALKLPNDPRDHPDPSALAWHRDRRFEK